MKLMTKYESKTISNRTSWMTESILDLFVIVKELIVNNLIIPSSDKKVKLSRIRRRKTTTTTTQNCCCCLFAWIVAVVVICEHVNASSELRLGGAINLFSRYGYLSISMRVVPRNDTDSKWLYREPTIDIFKDLSSLVLTPSNNPQSPKKVFEGDFHMEFCDNLRQLLQAYFRGFNFERLDRPWRAFSGEL